MLELVSRGLYVETILIDLVTVLVFKSIISKKVTGVFSGNTL